MGLILHSDLQKSPTKTALTKINSLMLSAWSRLSAYRAPGNDTAHQKLLEAKVNCQKIISKFLY